MAKKDKGYQKVYSKNRLKMKGIFLFNEGYIMSEVFKIREKYGIKKDLPTIDPTENQGQFADLIKKGSREMKKFHKRIGNESSNYYNDLLNLIHKLNLGREWTTPLDKFVISGIIGPPPFSVFVDENEEDGVIVFELNKDTTLEDLNYAWKTIEFIRKKMFGRLRANFPTKRGINNFSKLSQLKSATLGDEISSSDGKETYKMRRIDAIAEIYPDEEDITKEADIKRLNKLKAAKFRFKKVTS